MSKNQAFLKSGTKNSDLYGQSIHVIINRHFIIPYSRDNHIKEFL